MPFDEPACPRMLPAAHKAELDACGHGKHHIAPRWGAQRLWIKPSRAFIRPAQQDAFGTVFAHLSSEVHMNALRFSLLTLAAAGCAVAQAPNPVQQGVPVVSGDPVPIFKV